MLRVKASSIRGKTVMLAPMGIEWDTTPCLVHHDPTCNLVPWTRVADGPDDEIVTTKAHGLRGINRGLRAAAKRLGLVVDENRTYCP